MNPAQMVAEILRLIRRRFFLLSSIILLGGALSVFAAFLRAPIFEASAQIVIEAQQVSDELARSTVNTSAGERLQRIQQRLMTRERLLAVIERHGIYADDTKTTPNEKIDQLRDATRIESIQATPPGVPAPNPGIVSIRITLTLGDPVQAAAVANYFAETVLAQNQEERADRARETLEFVTAEEARLSEAITALEAEIREYKTANEQALPTSLEFRYQELAQVRETAREIEREILDLEEERRRLATALEGRRPLGGGAARDGDPGPRSPEETELRRLQTELARQRILLSPNHPQIRQLEAQIISMTALVSQLSSASNVLSSLDVSTEGQRQVVREQIADLDEQIALQRTQLAEFQARQASLEASIAQTPGVEIALNALDRRYTDLQTQLSEATRKRAEAETGQMLESNQQSERFEVAEAAIVPEAPISPDRKKIVALGGALSVALAVGLVVLLEMLNPVIRSTAQLERRLGLKPVISLPYVPSPVEERLARTAKWTAVAALVASVPAGLWAVDSQVMPLGDLAAQTAERFGIDGAIERLSERFGG